MASPRNELELDLSQDGLRKGGIRGKRDNLWQVMLFLFKAYRSVHFSMLLSQIDSSQHHFGGQMLVHLFQELICFRQCAIYIDIGSASIIYLKCMYIHTHILTPCTRPEESSGFPSAKLRRWDIFGRCSGRSGEETRAADLAKCGALASDFGAWSMGRS